MGAAGSKPDDEGIITVNSKSSSLQTRAGPASTTATQQAVDPLLHHLHELRAKVPHLDAANISTTKAATAADVEGLLTDIEQLKQLSGDTGNLNAAITTLLTTYQAWHNENIKLITTNQEYIHRLIDSAESKADKAVRHVQLQTSKLKTITAGLDDATALPSMLAQITAATAALQNQMQQLEQLHEQQQDRAAAVEVQRPGSSSSSSSLFRRSKSPTVKQQQQQVLQQQRLQQGSND